MMRQSSTTQKVKRIPIDLGGATPICIEPHRRPYPTGEWVSAMIDSYLSRDDFDAQNVSISFVQGGVPNQELIYALSNRPFTLATRPDELSRKDAEWLVEQGCQGIELNVYTTQQFVLDRNGIFYNLDIIEEMVEFFQEKDLEVGIHLVYGLPHAELEGCINDVRIFCNLNVDYLRLAPVLVLSGSELEMMYRAGRYFPVSTEESIQYLHSAFQISEESNIPIVRMGWQSKNDFGVSTVAGPESNNLRAEVLERAFRYRIIGVVAGFGGKNIVLSFHPKDEGYVRGKGNCNIKFVSQKLRCPSIQLKRDTTLQRCEIRCHSFHEDV